MPSSLPTVLVWMDVCCEATLGFWVGHNTLSDCPVLRRAPDQNSGRDIPQIDHEEDLETVVDASNAISAGNSKSVGVDIKQIVELGCFGLESCRCGSCPEVALTDSDWGQIAYGIAVKPICYYGRIKRNSPLLHY